MVLPVHMQFAYCWFDIGGLELNIFILYRQQLLAEHVIRFHLGVKKYKLIKPTSNSLTQCKCYISCFNSPNMLGTVAEKHIPHKWKIEETRDVPCVMSYFTLSIVNACFPCMCMGPLQFLVLLLTHMRVSLTGKHWGCLSLCISSVINWQPVPYLSLTVS